MEIKIEVTVVLVLQKSFFFNCMNLKLNERNLNSSHFPDSNQVTQWVFFFIFSTLYFETVGFHLSKSLRSFLEHGRVGRVGSK